MHSPTAAPFFDNNSFENGCSAGGAPDVDDDDDDDDEEDIDDDDDEEPIMIQDGMMEWSSSSCALCLKGLFHFFSIYNGVLSGKSSGRREEEERTH